MTSERWRRIEHLFHAALQRNPALRHEFLAQACAGDEELRTQVESLLAQNLSKPNLLDRPAWHAAIAEPMVVNGVAVRLTPETMVGRTLGFYEVLSPLLISANRDRITRNQKLADSSPRPRFPI
jgi:eukaryotic-like serine/threonine-protein kinase